MSAQHTPGPWQNGMDDLEGVVAVGPVALVGDGNVVCLPPDWGMVASRARWPANARLIAVLPELLKALHQYRNDMKYPVAPDSAERRIAMIDALILKATGEPA